MGPEPQAHGTHSDDEGEHHKHEAEPDLQLGKRRVVRLPLKQETDVCVGGGGGRDRAGRDSGGVGCVSMLPKTTKVRSAPKGRSPDDQKLLSHGEGTGRHTQH